MDTHDIPGSNTVVAATGACRRGGVLAVLCAGLALHSHIAILCRTR